MASLKSMSRGRFKRKSSKSTSRTMAKRRTRRRSPIRRMTRRVGRRRSSGVSSSGVFSGKILGFNIPVIGGILRNKSVQKAAAGMGLVSLVLTAAAFINNDKVNSALAKRPVRLALAAAGGDVIGVGAEFVREGGIDSIRGGGNGGQTQNTLVAAGGNGVA